jgi:8-oxo-dGTP pyrophosphatase MutT (NUDIX family)
VSTSEFDPAAVPIRPAATVMLLRDTPDGLEVFMLRRTTKAAFASGMYVFPGGAVDDADGGAPMAAVRECFEEAGVLLARTATGEVVRFDDPAVAARFAEHRREVHAGRLAMTAMLAAEGLTAQLDELVWVAHWITPLGEVRRFDTRFYVVAAPPEQEPLHDEQETIESRWVRPAEALERQRAGELVMLPPTIANLGFLAAYSTTAEVMAAAAQVGTPPCILPKVVTDGAGGILQLLMPGDVGYEEALG